MRGLRETLPLVSTVLVEVEGSNLDAAANVIDAPLIEAGFQQLPIGRVQNSGRNRLYINAKRLDPIHSPP